MATFTEELGELINKWSKESGSDTPDFILADYMSGCLYVFNLAVRERDMWYSFKPSPLNALHPVTTATSSGPNANSGFKRTLRLPMTDKELREQLDLPETYVPNEAKRKWFKFGAYDMARLISDKVKTL